MVKVDLTLSGNLTSFSKKDQHTKLLPHVQKKYAVRFYTIQCHVDRVILLFAKAGKSEWDEVNTLLTKKSQMQYLILNPVILRKNKRTARWIVVKTNTRAHLLKTRKFLHYKKNR